MLHIKLIVVVHIDCTCCENVSWDAIYLDLPSTSAHGGPSISEHAEDDQEGKWAIAITKLSAILVHQW